MRLPTRSTLPLVTITAAVAIVLSLHFFVQPLRPWPDQGRVIQAALRHAGGQGLTTLELNVHDLSAPIPRQMVYFPPFFPLLISSLVQLGLSVEHVIKGINALCLVVGLVGWITLASRVLPRTSWRVLFSSLLVVAGSALVPKGGTVDYMLWAATPFWVTWIHESRHRDAAQARRYVLASAVLIAFMIGIRWAAVVYVPAGCLALLLPGSRAMRLRRRLESAVLYGIIPTLTYIGITRLNVRLSAGVGDLLSGTTLAWRWHLLPDAYPLQSITTIPLAIEPILTRIARMPLRPELLQQAISLAGRILIPVLMLVFLAFYLLQRRRDMRVTAPEERGVWVVGGSLILGTLAFLSYMTVRYNWDHVAWTYLREPRYFRPIWPTAALLWLAVLTSFTRPKVRLAIVGGLAFGVLYLVQAQARWEVGFLRERDESLELISFLATTGGDSTAKIVFDNDVSDYVMPGRGRFLSSLYPDPADATTLSTRRDMELLLVRRTLERTAYVTDPEFDEKRFQALRTVVHASRTWRSSAGHFEVYRGFIAATTP